MCSIVELMHKLNKLIGSNVNLNSQVKVYDQQLLVLTVKINSEVKVHGAEIDCFNC